LKYVRYILEDEDLYDENFFNLSPRNLEEKKRKIEEEKKTGSFSAISKLPLMHRGDHQLTTVFQVEKCKYYVDCNKSFKHKFIFFFAFELFDLE
jgi:hypothetical protein